MKAIFFKGISYVFHPLFFPVYTLLYYFYITPKFFSNGIIKAKLFSVALLTIVLPLLAFFLLRTIKKVKTIDLKTTKERIIPLLLNCVIIGLVIIRVLTASEIIELHYFFIGSLVSYLLCLIFVLLKLKASIHMIALSSFFAFIIGLHFYYKINASLVIALAIFSIGIISTSRLYLKAHTNKELVVGFLTGTIPQIVILSYWL